MRRSDFFGKLRLEKNPGDRPGGLCIVPAMNRKSVVVWGVLAVLAVILGGLLLFRPPVAESPALEADGATARGADGEDPAKPKIAPAAREMRPFSETEQKPLALDDAAEAMRRALALPEMNMRAKAAAFVIRDLCAAGYTEEAWRMIRKENDQVRQAQLLMFFNHTEPMPPLAVLEKMKELAGPAEVKSALDAYLSKHTLGEIGKLVEEPGFLAAFQALEAGYPPGTVPVLVQIMDEHLRASRSDADRGRVAEFALAMYQLKAVDAITLMGTLRADSSHDPFARWEQVSAALADVATVFENEPNRSALIDAMVAGDPAKAMETLARGDSPQALADLAVGVSQWTSVDRTSAAGWFMANGPKLAAAQRDTAHAVLSRTSRKAGNAEAAKAWAEKVEDPKVRAELLEGL